MFQRCKTTNFRLCISEVRFLFTNSWNTKPDEGSFIQPKHVAFLITLVKCCVQTGCCIVVYRLDVVLLFTDWMLCCCVQTGRCIVVYRQCFIVVYRRDVALLCTDWMFYCCVQTGCCIVVYRLDVVLLRIDNDTAGMTIH